MRMVFREYLVFILGVLGRSTVHAVSRKACSFTVTVHK